MKGKTHPPRMHRASSDELNLNSELYSLKPSEIRHELDRFIIGQEKAKKVLSVAIYNHMKRLNDESGLIKKSNILLVGPSGSGKTLLAETIANILNVSFATLDSTTISPIGFVGNDVQVCVQKLIALSKGNIALAQKGVIFIDEIDKLAGTTVNQSNASFSIGTQATLLKLIEKSEDITLPAVGKMRGSETNLITMNTKNILFICGGAFSGLNDSGKQGNPIEFCTSKRISEAESSAINHEAIVKYGLIQELVGRLPVLTVLEELREDELVRILTEPENAITKEYQLLFKKDGINLHFEDEALHEIAKKALANKTGARGLRTILEDILLDIMFDIPNMENIATCIITKETLTTKVPVLIETESASDSISEQGAF